MIDKFITEFLLAFLIENRTVIILGLLAFVNELIEYYLGKTDKVRAGSKLELLIIFIKKIKSVFKK